MPKYTIIGVGSILDLYSYMRKIISFLFKISIIDLNKLQFK